MTTSGTYYYQPSADTGNLLISNPPFIMTTQQPTPAEGLPELTQEQFLRLSAEAGVADRPLMVYTGEHAVAIARAAYQLGADVELEACCEWLRGFGFRVAIDAFCAARRPKPPSLREQALAAARIELNANGKNGALIIRALEALPE